MTTDNKIWWKKVRGILKVIDEELGYTTEEHRVMSNLKASGYFYEFCSFMKYLVYTLVKN